MACFVVHWVHADTRDITHDEAATWFNYALGPVADIFVYTRYDANNHILHSLLCNIVNKSLGPAPLALRLPALAGSLIFLLCACFLCRHYLHSPFLALLALGMLALNPLIFDFFSLARGYSLALAFLLLAFCLLAGALRRPALLSEPARLKGRLVGASLAMGVSVLVHPYFVFTNGALAFAFLILATIAADRHRQGCFPYFSRCFLLVCLPGALLDGLVYSKILTLARMRSGNRMNGTDSLLTSARDLLEYSFGLKGPIEGIVTSRPELAGQVSLLAALLGVLLAALAALLAWRAWNLWHGLSMRHRLGDLLLCLAGLTFLTNIIFLAGAHQFANLHFPTGRLGMGLILFFNLWMALTLDHSLWRTAHLHPVRTLALVLGVIMLYYQASRVGPSAWYTLESDMSRISRSLDQLTRQRSRTPLLVDVDWVLIPSLNYYRVARGQAMTAAIRINAERRFTPGGDAYIGIEGAGLVTKELQVYDRGPHSGVCLAIPSRNYSQVAAPRPVRP